jgi:O-antigen/teichoic acid export membrane protein
MFLTILAITTWANVFNSGFGDKLKNDLGSLISTSSTENIKSVISTYYYLISIVSFTLIIVVLTSYFVYISFPIEKVNLIIIKMLFVTLSLYIISFLTDLINNIFSAFLMNSLANVTNFISVFLTTVLLVYATKQNIKSPIIIAIYTFIPRLSVNLMATVVFFAFKSNITPSFKNVKRNNIKAILIGNLKFFYISIAGIVMRSIDTLLVNIIIGPNAVPILNIGKKYLSVTLYVFSLFTSPLWSNITNACAMKDFKWIEKTVKNLINIATSLVFVNVILIIGAPIIFKIWLGDLKYFDFPVLLILTILNSILLISSVFTLTLNGMNILDVQIKLCTFAIIANVPISIVFAKCLNFGISGIIMGTFVTTILSTYYQHRIYKKTIMRSFHDLSIM